MFLIILVILLSLIYFWINYNQNYFKRHNVKYLKSTPLIGALKDTIFGKKSLYDNYLEIYQNPAIEKEPFFGMFIFHKPALMIKDPELAKKVLITDFKSFNSRYGGCDIHDKLGYYSIVFAKYPLWKIMRQNISVFFTNAKLKSAYYLIEKIGSDFNKMLHKKLNSSNQLEVNLKPTTDSYFVDVIMSIALGVESKCIENPDNEFQVAAAAVVELKKLSRAIGFLWLLPKYTKYFGFKLMPKITSDLLYDVTSVVFKERLKSSIKRNDLIDILLDMRSQLKPHHKSHAPEDMMIAQIAVFLAAGFHTSSSTAGFVMYELSKNQEIQSKLRNEIKEILLNNGGIVPYESVANPTAMPYFHQVISETLRLYQILAVLDRECNEPNGYSLEPYSSFKVPYGMPVFICTFGMSRDEKYFPEPLKFDPDRFSSENINNIPPVYYPFGAGPRNCVGGKLAFIEMKNCIINVLKDFRIERTEKTPDVIEFQKNAFTIVPEKELFVNFVKDKLID